MVCIGHNPSQTSCEVAAHFRLPSVLEMISLRTFRKCCPLPFASLPRHVLSGSYFSSLSSSASPPLILFQFRVCPRCNSIRALLDYCAIPYVTEEVNPLTRREVIRHDSVTSENQWDVPILLVPNKDKNNIKYKQLNGIGCIMQALESMCGVENLTEETKQEMEWLCTDMITLLSVNVFRTLIEARETVRYVHNISSFKRYQQILLAAVGPLFMRFVWAPHYLNRYRILHSRKALFEAIQTWTNKIHQLDPQPSPLRRYSTTTTTSITSSSTSTTTSCTTDCLSGGRGEDQHEGFYRGGVEPNICDLIMFGQLRGIEGLRVSRELFFFYPDLYQWYCDMVRVVGPSSEVKKRDP
eukprot:GHVS01028114.1.p1 GENE.GHVS01028114.1~~GHVS01028114.1.p1  ORF type:complete len:354 (+),score=37.07 GHVS01028114.1:171-1232(+)